MEEAVISSLKRSLRSPGRNVTLDVRIVKDRTDIFIREVLDSISGAYVLSSQNPRNDYQYYRCERSRHARGKSSGIPVKQEPIHVWLMSVSSL